MKNQNMPIEDEWDTSSICEKIEEVKKTSDY